MANKRSNVHGSSTLPSKEAILDFIKSQNSGPSRPGRIGKREIAKAFDIKGNSRIGLKAVLKELEIEKAVTRRGRTLHRPGALSPMVLANIIGIDHRGDFVVVPSEWEIERDGSIPNIHISSKNKGHSKNSSARIGDVVLIRMDTTNTNKTPFNSGRIIKIFEKKQTKIVGVYKYNKDQRSGTILPVEKKGLDRKIIVRDGDEGTASDNDLVIASLTKGGQFGLYSAKIIEVVGPLASEKSVSIIALNIHGIPDQFSLAALAEAEAAPTAMMEIGLGMKREDWRSIPFVTIDPEDAKDHDDAVHAIHDMDPENAGGYVVTIAIADVSSYITQGSALDREALERGNSVYFPDRVVPMLPDRISNDLCSLKPNEDRPALAVKIIIGADGQKRKHSFHRILIRSVAKLSYGRAQSLIDGNSLDADTPSIEKILKHLWNAWSLQLGERNRRAPLELDLPEKKLKLKADGSVDSVYTPARLDAHRLIEDFMIMANVAAAEELEHRQVPFIYRVHDEPSSEKLRNFKEVLASIGVKMTLGEAVDPSFFNKVLSKINGSPHQAFINDVALRSQAQAQYSSENYGHFGLNLSRYTHFTSPIRRYSDIIAHRALIRALKLGSDGLQNDVIPKLAELAATLSAAERRSISAERETIDRLIAHYLSNRVGASFFGRISGVTRSGLFVKLKESGADGFVPASTIGKDFYKFDEAKHALVGQRTSETFRLGDEVKVKLLEASPIAGALRFELLSVLRYQDDSSFREGISKRSRKRKKIRRPHEY
ncbi:MAG: ribonuclease R [Hyphomicrobiales bacterium]